MRILSIETSCDETSAAVIEKTDSSLKTLSLVIASSSNLHKTTGGIIPETAARAQLEYILPVIFQSLFESTGKKFSNIATEHQEGMTILQNSIDAIAVTQGPGLIGSLLVGIETAKTLALLYNKPLIPVNHLLAHLYANYISDPSPLPTSSFPFIGLIVSGGHTDLLLFKNHESFTWLGGTRDDAAGEAFDKIGRVLGLSYPAGPEIEKYALNATEKSIKFSRALKNSDDFDFSFSGLKTEASRFIHKQENLSKQDISEIAYAVQDAITDILVHKTLNAAQKYNCNTIVLGGGVSANQFLRDSFKQAAEHNNLSLYFPTKILTTDNAAMIGGYAALNYNPVPLSDVIASPELHLI